ncbi:hypothetical protein NLU13_5479 [Sarocladium strictum]|uniref:Aminotransferase class I/classII large domain-containing protein n=1 Tax=Sarocladium strictum TaxID=5046 RepID=A0AA39L793_SARSR|nr:hypothetical protein NLU13_5479 [Sarocladium strictum]
MVRVNPFAVEQWMDKYEHTPGVLNISETCAASISINDLMRMSTDADTKTPFDPDDKMTYGAIRGSQQLREHIASLCSSETGEKLSSDNVLITQGAIQANFLALYTLIGPGDHVISVYPTYQQLYSVPSSLGAETSLWKLREEHGFVPDLTELEGLVKDNTKMIIVNNPNNPTGAPIPGKIMKGIADFAKQRDIILLSDEVYRPLWHSLSAGTEPPPPATALGHKRTVVTGSMSKAFALAGIRLGWVVSPDSSIIEAIAAARDYTTISVSKLDDRVAAYALSPEVQPSLLRRNMELAAHNFKMVKAFVEKYSSVCSWVEPQAGTTAFIQFRTKGKPVVDTEFCLDLLEKTKVFVVPGSHCFGGGEDFEGYVRMGYVSETDVLEEALKRLGQYIESNLL